ncbi:hydrogenase nickel incorporation protein HypB [Smithella sp. F21]|nr:hydrogenase nickel incorporation protein HypB [Smithella sp. F21]HBJ75510.1 hydrogenase accessory protein HypB [Syntrophaceae bacterium]HBL52513.1 hydrogenase accessory protein HypB [Syntrophaceae bacterium]HCS76495.1 hydrogenase accessory protein HypB [Syntrophaceae bacterium]HCX02407.1 hydrogenase accessory protein HypB [Syntrophaceae bacterium]
MEDVRLIEVKKEILADNNQIARGVRERLRRTKTLLLNLMSSPGSGKTSLILRTVERLKSTIRIGVIEADIDSTVDAEKVAAGGIPAVQLRTGGFCHLDATMVTQGLDALNAEDLDLIIIENVGNLVCPAEFDTGAHKNVMILSVPEGDDKPLKYPLMFSICDVLLINKIDYLSLSDFDMAALRKRALVLNPNIKIIEISCKTAADIGEWIAWLKQEVDVFQMKQGGS